MADFTALKTAIQTYIKQNGNEEIKGDILQEILLSVVTTLGDSAINDLITALNDEVAARQNADGTLQQNITNEATARGNADTALGGRIDDEATARANGDMALSNRLGSTITAENTAADQIGAEAEARAAADTALQELIDGITDNIENGYVYAGIATPSSTPTTGKVFYLALTAGTYTHFGNAEVSQGINILKFNGSAWSLDAFIGIDDELTPGSNNLPKSGNVLENIIKNGSAFDLSAYNAVDGVLATYADLDAALTALNALPAVYKQGGMSVKFVHTSDNKYVQFRLMAQSFTPDITQWQGVETVASSGSKNLVDGDGIAKGMVQSIGGFFVDYNHLIDISAESEVTYLFRDTHDCFWMLAPNNAKKITISGISISGNYQYFNSPIPSTESRLGANNTGDIPNGTVLILHNFSKSLNQNYDYTKITYEYNIDNVPTKNSTRLVDSNGVHNGIYQSSRNLFIDYGHIMEISGEGTATYHTSTDYDCFWFFTSGIVSKITLGGITFNGLYLYFDSVVPSSNARLGSNDTGIVPGNTALVMVNVPKNSNQNYDSLSVEYEYSVIKKNDYSVSKGLYIDYHHALTKSGGVVNYEKNTDFDCFLIPLSLNAKKITINGITFTGSYHYFSSMQPSTESWIGSNNDGIIPSNAVLALHNVAVSNNNNYDNANIQFEYKTEAYPALNNQLAVSSDGIFRGLKSSLNHYLIDYNHLVNISAESEVTYIASDTRDCFWIYLPENVSKVTLDGVTFTGNYQYFSSVIPTTESRIGANSTGIVPLGTVLVLKNVVKSDNLNYDAVEIKLEYIETGGSDVGPLKVVVMQDKSFYVRYNIDDTNDGILRFNYYTAYAYDRNCIMMSRFYVGTKDETDATILAKTTYQNCDDSQSPMFTSNFGPMFSNHGYSTPKVVITDHGLTDSDIGSEWTDQNDYHYTIGNIDGNNIYLLPIIYTTGVPGEETRNWKWYSSPYPTQITRVGDTAETLSVSSSSRWDYQVSELINVRVLINGKSVENGIYYCNEVELAYEQIGYNPINIQTWYPRPVYNGVMLKFDRHFTVSGGKGFLSLTSNTVLNNLYPYPLYHYIDVVPQFPFQLGDYKPYIYIPKMNKHDGDIDFREEFVSVDNSHSAVHYYRNTNDVVDVDDMPDRAYSYLKTDLGAILYGCAGGHSLVRGMSVKSVRNNYIEMNGALGIWYPSAGNKHYNNILQTTNETNNILPDTFINEFEGYMCWYKPQNGVHCFYHRTKEGYVVYIHTNQTINKGYATLPDFMNNLAVDSIVEKTDGITLKTNTVVDGKIFFSSDNSEKEYNWVVFILK